MNWHTLTKVLTGIIIVPMAIAARSLWPWWEKTPLPVRILSGMLVLPFVGLTAVLTNWWGSY